MISHPTTPPMAQISMVMMLMGIGGERKRFVNNNSSTPTTALMANPTNPPPKAISVVRRAEINNATTNMTTTMSTSNSMWHNFSRRPDCLPASKGVDDELPLFTQMPRARIFSETSVHQKPSRKLGLRHTGFSQTSFRQYSMYYSSPLYRLADFGLGPYLLVPGVLSCTVNTSKTIHPMNGTSETRTHQPLRSVS